MQRDTLHCPGATVRSQIAPPSAQKRRLRDTAFTQQVVGNTTLAGFPALHLVDEGAAAPMPADAKSIVAIDQGRLRFGADSGAGDSDGFPTAFEKPADAYTRQ